MLETSESSWLKPPFTKESALAKVHQIQNVWSGCNANRVIQMFDDHAELLNRGKLVQGSAAILSLLAHRLQRELHCNMTMKLWSVSASRISASFYSEWQDAIRGQWYRTEGNMQMCFNTQGLFTKLSVMAFDIPITNGERIIESQQARRSDGRKS